MAERSKEWKQLGSGGAAVAEREEHTLSTTEIRQDIEHTRASLGEKLGALQEKVNAVQAQAKKTLDLPYQVEQHPWAALGTSVAVGFVVGSLTSRAHAAAQAPVWSVRAQASGMPEFAAVSSIAPGPLPHARRPSPRGDLFATLKLAVGAALMDLARNTIKQHAPKLGEQIDSVWKERGLTSVSAASAFFDKGDGILEG